MNNGEMQCFIETDRKENILRWWSTI